MDLATIIGMLGAFGVIVGAIALGGSVGVFFNVPSLVLVVVGTMFIVIFRSTLKQFVGSFKIAAGAFFSKTIPPETLIDEAVELATVARKEGLLALEGREIAHPFLKRGIGMCIDGNPPETVRRVLSKDINLTIQRHEDGYGIFKATGDIAPAMGMIGTLIGLVQMLSAMDDPKAIGPAMAVALLTTLYGAVIANAFAIPIADKLKLRSKEERLNKSLILESINGIQEGINPRVLEQILLNYLPANQRQSREKD